MQEEEGGCFFLMATTSPYTVIIISHREEIRSKRGLQTLVPGSIASLNSRVFITSVSVFLQHASADVEKLLIGNKCDWEARRVVSKEKGESLASNQGVPFLETSAKTNYNIDEAFERLARLILRKVSQFTGMV